MAHTDRSPLILIDVDSVLVEHNGQHIEEVNKIFGTKFTFSDITSFEYDFLTTKQREHVFKCWREMSYAEDELTADQIMTLDAMREIGRVVACTSPMPGPHIESKYNFLLKYFDRKDIIMASDKYLVSGDILIDDAPHNINDWRSTGRPAIVFDKPWNRGVRADARTNDFTALAPITAGLLWENGYDII